MNPCTQRAMMFVGAVIGAGFASGREVVSFFSCYGNASWWMILLSVCTMAGLCSLCLKRSHGTSGCGWCEMYAGDGLLTKGMAEVCVLFLQIVMGGSMISAAGHIAELAIPLRWAYLAGVMVTIGAALALGGASLRPMTVLSSVLSGTFVLAVLAVLVFDRGEVLAVPIAAASQQETACGAIRAVGYASMNIAISIGMVCRCGGCSCRVSNRSAVLFGLLMTALLFISNYLYLKHPELKKSTFPMVSLLGRFGRAGYGISLLLMYMAILTTLSAGLYALRTGLEARLSRKTAMVLTVLLPLGVSFVGFESIVDRWYAPAGLLCLLLVFAPLLAWGNRFGKKSS